MSDEPELERPVTARPNPRAVNYAARLPAGSFSLDGRWLPPTQEDIDVWLTDDEDHDG